MMRKKRITKKQSQDALAFQSPRKMRRKLTILKSSSSYGTWVVHDSFRINLPTYFWSKKAAESFALSIKLLNPYTTDIL